MYCVQPGRKTCATLQLWLVDWGGRVGEGGDSPGVIACCMIYFHGSGKLVVMLRAIPLPDKTSSRNKAAKLLKRKIYQDLIMKKIQYYL